MRRRVARVAAFGFLLTLCGCVVHTVPPEPKPLDWDGFWKVFRDASLVRDRATLRSIMTDKFDYTFGGGEATPENAFAFWDRAEIGGWEALAEAARKGAVDYTPPPQWEAKGRVRIAPPEASQEGYRQWRAVFEQQTGGEWRFTAFLHGD